MCPIFVIAKLYSNHSMKYFTFLKPLIVVLIFTLTIAVSYSQTPCSGLFFSEYVESGSTKALEIYNASASPISLSDYEIHIFSNGNTTASATIELGNKTLLSDSAFVVSDLSPGPVVSAVADTTTGSMSYTGNDAILLVNVTLGDTIDIIGVIGQDPGTAWSGGGLSTEDIVLKRKFTIQFGVISNPTTFDPSVEWVAGDSIDDYVNLGIHSSSCNVQTTNCNELFFSEYIEEGANKALEIYNPTNAPITMSDYEVHRFTNGSSVANGTVAFNGKQVGAGQTYIVASSIAGATLIGLSDTISPEISFNGNDAVALINVSTGDTVDIIGVIGVNPGIAWSNNGISTEDMVLIRKFSVEKGLSSNPSTFDPSVEWDTASNNTDYSDLGSHSSSCQDCYVYEDTINDSICELTETYSFRGQTISSTGTYKDTAFGVTCDTVFTLILDTITYKETPLVVFDQATNQDVCAGDILELSVSTINHELDVDYYWIINGVEYAHTGGDSTLTIPSDSLEDGDEIYVEADYSNACVLDPSSISDTIIINKPNFNKPTITKVVDTLMVANNAGAYAWYKDSVLLPGNDTNRITINSADSACYYVEALDSSATCLLFSDEFCVGCLFVVDTIFDTICNLTENYDFRGQTLTEAGTYSDTSTMGDCDSIFTIVLDTSVYITTPSIVFDQGTAQDVCDGDVLELSVSTNNHELDVDYYWIINGVEYAHTASDSTISIPSDSLEDGDEIYVDADYSNNCVLNPSSISDTIIINKPNFAKPTITQVEDTLFVVNNAGAYAWYKDSVLLPGNDTNRITINPADSACYYVEALDSSATCLLTSEEYCIVNCALFTPQIILSNDTLFVSEGTIDTWYKDGVSFLGGPFFALIDTNEAACYSADVSNNGTGCLATTDTICIQPQDTTSCAELFLSEYTEGTGTNKVLEIYNPTTDTVDLTSYSIEIFANGGTTPNNTISLTGSLNPYKVHVLANNTADVEFTSKADQLSAALSFNGNDAILLLKGTDTVDIFGEIGNDPGPTGWEGLTADMTWVRKSTISEGLKSNPNAFDPFEEWNFTVVDDTADLGMHSSNCNNCVFQGDTLDVTVCSGENVFYRDTAYGYGDHIYYAEGTSCDTIFIIKIDTFVITKPVISLLNDSLLIVNSDNVVDWYRADTLLDAFLVDTLVIDPSIEACYKVEAEDTTTGCVVFSEEFCVTPLLDSTDCAELFFSTYLEGPSGFGNDKALEIFNPTADPIDLADYKVTVYTNGAPNVNQTLDIQGTIAPYDVFVIGRSTADSVLLTKVDTISGIMNHTGNEVFILFNDTIQIDIIGSLGTDSVWTENGVSTANQLLVRKPFVKKGITNNPYPFDPSLEWETRPAQDYFEFDGHTSDCQQDCEVFVDTIYDTICEFDIYSFRGETVFDQGFHYDTSSLGTCDTVFTLHLDFYQVTLPTIVANTGGDTLTVSSGDVIAWRDLDGNILGDTSFLIIDPNDTICIFASVTDPVHGCLNYTPDYCINQCTIYADTIYDTICESGIYSFRGKTVFDQGFHYDTSSLGTCDTIFTLQLDFYQVTLPTIVANGDTLRVTSGDVIAWRDTLGNILGDTSFYVLTANDTNCVFASVTDPIHGCLNYTPNYCPADSACYVQGDTLVDTICSDDFYAFGSQILTMAGTYVDTVENTNGCDTILTLHLETKNCTDTSDCGELFISEYIEGTGFNKAIEIYNPTTGPIDLSTYSIVLFNNGDTTATATYPLSGSLASYDVFVVARATADAGILSEADMTAGFTYNGDDAVVLYKDSTIIDIFGKIGDLPGSNGWGTGTKDMTWVRQASVNKGTRVNPISFDPANEWFATSTDDSTHLGEHNSTCADCYVIADTLFQEQCTDLTYIWRGQSYTPGNTYNDTSFGTGCDTIFTLVLNEVITAQITIVEVNDSTLTVSDGLVLDWYKDGVLFTSNTDTITISTDDTACYYAEVVDTFVYCATETPNFCIGCTPYSDTIYDTICTNDSINFRGTWYYTAGTYNDVVSGSTACDSTFVLVLNNYPVIQPNIVVTSDTILSVDYGQVAGWYNKNDPLTVISVDQTLTISSNDTSCYDAFVLDTVTGCYIFSDEYCAGCNSLYDTIQQEICNGDSVLFNGAYRSVTGLYVDTTVGQNGCDNYLYMDLIVSDAPITNIYDTICSGDSVLFQGFYVKNPGTYQETFPFSPSCDSTVILHLEVSGAIPTNVSITASTTTVCSNDTIQFTSSSNGGGNTPVYQWLINGVPVANGPSFTNTPGQIVGGDVVQAYMISSLSCAIEDTVYSNTITITGGAASARDTTQDTICQGESYLWGNNTYTTAGTYFDTIATSGGCDSIRVLQLFSHPIPIVIANIGPGEDTIPVNGTVNFDPNGSNASNYEWDFGDGNTSTLNTVSHTYTAPGVYTVILRGDLIFGCSAYDTVTIVVEGNPGVEELMNNDRLGVYPNPVADMLTIEFNGDQSVIEEVQLVDAKGNVVFTNVYDSKARITTIDFSNYERGVYFVRVRGEQLNKHVRVIKIN